MHSTGMPDTDSDCAGGVVAQTPREVPPASYLAPLIRLAGIQALVVLFAGLNVYLPITEAEFIPGLAIRWREMLALSLVTPLSVCVVFLLHRRMEVDADSASSGPLALLVLGACWLCISMGVHEPINAIWRTAGLEGAVAGGNGELGRVLAFWDDLYSHVFFFAGFVALSLSLLWSQRRRPLASPMGARVSLGVALLAVLAGLGIFFSLTGSCHAIDLVVLALVVLVAEALRGGRAFRRMPLSILLGGAYFLSFVLLLLFG